MKKALLIGLATVSISVAACQTDSYKIKGSGDALHDGDTLYLTTDVYNGTPSDTIVVKDGKFEISAKTDSTYFCLIYNPKRQDVSQMLFIEPGTIEVNLSDKPMLSKVSGTKTNDIWQELNDTTTRIGLKMSQIATSVYGKQLSEAEQKAKMAEVEKLSKEFNECVVGYAERNIDNELGYFLLTFYPTEVIEPDRRLALIKKMPKQMQNRPAVKSMVEKMERQSKYAAGKPMPDFKMTDIDGKEISVLQEIKQHELTIIDFWASWCGPCRAEMPSVVKLYEQYHDKGLGIIGISLDEKKDSWESAVKTLGMKWTQLSDLKGWQNAAARMFNVESIPHTIVVDKNGTILQHGLRGEELSSFVASKLQH